MDEIKLSDDVIEQIKDFRDYRLTEQGWLIDKLILDKNLKERYKKYAKGGFGTTFKAVWKEGRILGWDYNNNQWNRIGKTQVALKCLHNSQGITSEFLQEVESNILACESGLGFVVSCFGITKDPNTNNFMMVMELKKGSLRQKLNDDFNSLYWKNRLNMLRCIAAGLSDIHSSGLIHLYDIINQCWDADLSKRPKAIELEKLFTYLWNDIISKNENNSVIYEQIKEAEEINKKSPSTVQSPLSSTGTLAYTTHPQAVYISRLLIYKNPPKPKNADNNDDSSGIQYSESLRMDFTKLDINSKDNSN
ncbi:uncharacterized protein OCT59_004577 [Rhizophagus irregularis]|uniref:uncharacterized protein n=1 Tax=Rhizophagus irregularis TaxID=588596 RepID=UPI0033178E8F|nr:hypothetical protein OCT59_004577 [Rhizophagus irregularis]